MKRLAHVEKHLRPRDRAFLPYLLRPLTLDEIAAAMNYSRSAVEQAWDQIRVAMALPDGRGSTSVGRLSLLRLVLALDPCVCERFSADLEEAS